MTEARVMNDVVAPRAHHAHACLACPRAAAGRGGDSLPSSAAEVMHGPGDARAGR